MDSLLELEHDEFTFLLNFDVFCLASLLFILLALGFFFLYSSDPFWTLFYIYNVIEVRLCQSIPKRDQTRALNTHESKDSIVPKNV
jgi:hypothetical protein